MDDLAQPRHPTDDGGRLAVQLPTAGDPECAVAEVGEFFTSTRIVKIAILTGLVAALFGGTLLDLFDILWNKNDWNHGLLTPLFSVGLLIMLRDRWVRRPASPSYLGLVVMLVSVVAYLASVLWLQNNMPAYYACWLMMVALVITLNGWRLAAMLWFPMVFLLFGVPVAGRLYNPVSTNLQQVSAVVAGGLLRLVGIEVERSGVVITMFKNGAPVAPSLQVEEACSGMHTLMALLALGVLIVYCMGTWMRGRVSSRQVLVREAFLAAGLLGCLVSAGLFYKQYYAALGVVGAATLVLLWLSGWRRMIFLLLIVPITILANSVRVLVLGLFGYFGQGALVEAKTFGHTLVGLSVFVVALALFWLVYVILERIVEEDESSAAESAAGAAAVPVRAARAWDWPTIRRGLWQPHFLAAGLLLLVTAAAWTAVVNVIGVHFKKEPVPLRLALDRLPTRIDRADGSAWVALSSGAPTERVLDQATEDKLGAVHPSRLRPGVPTGVADSPKLLRQSQYVQRDFHLVDAGGKDASQPMSLFIGFYTGTNNIVAHIPERCWTGAGFVEDDSRDMPVRVSDTLTIPLRVAQFRGDGKTHSAGLQGVAYTFNYNGQFSSNHTTVRLKLNSPFGKKAYMAKIEVTLLGEARSLDEQRAAAELLLRDVMPILMKDYLPQWSDADN